MGKKIEKVAAEICLYGAAHCGFGFLAHGPASLVGGKVVAGGGKMFGEGGEGLKFGSCTEAMWAGLAALEAACLPAKSLVAVFMPGGEKMAKVKLGSAWPRLGGLELEPAPVYVVSAAEIEAAAEKGGK